MLQKSDKQSNVPVNLFKKASGAFAKQLSAFFMLQARLLAFKKFGRRFLFFFIYYKVSYIKYRNIHNEQHKQCGKCRKREQCNITEQYTMCNTDIVACNVDMFVVTESAIANTPD